jgi:hypothetical protein
MEVSGQRYAPAALYPRKKDPRYPLYRRMGGPQSRSGHRGYRKSPLPLLGIEHRSSGRPGRLSDTILTELPLLYNVCTMNQLQKNFSNLCLNCMWIMADWHESKFYSSVNYHSWVSIPNFIATILLVSWMTRAGRQSTTTYNWFTQYAHFVQTVWIFMSKDAKQAEKYLPGLNSLALLAASDLTHATASTNRILRNASGFYLWPARLASDFGEWSRGACSEGKRQHSKETQPNSHWTQKNEWQTKRLETATDGDSTDQEICNWFCGNWFIFPLRYFQPVDFHLNNFNPVHNFTTCLRNKANCNIILTCMPRHHTYMSPATQVVSDSRVHVRATRLTPKQSCPATAMQAIRGRGITPTHSWPWL